MTDTPQTPLTDRLRDDRDLEKRWRKDSDDRAADLEATLVTRTQEVEHWVKRYNELEAWRAQTSRLLLESEAKVAALTADLAQVREDRDYWKSRAHGAGPC